MSDKPIFNLLEYLFARSSSQNKRITDTRWIHRLALIAPYLSILISMLILAWGIGAANATKMPINPHFFVFLGILFWTTICFICAYFLKKKGRSPAVPMIISFLIALKGLFVLLLFLGLQSGIKEIGKELIEESTNFSQHVQSKIQENRSLISRKFQEKESEVQKHMQKISKSIEDLNHHFEGAFERFKQTHKELSSLMHGRLAQAEQETKKMDQLFWDSVHKRQAELEAERKKTPSFFNSQKQDETPSQEDASCVDLPVICDGEKWLREHTKPEYLEGSTEQK